MLADQESRFSLFAAVFSTVPGDTLYALLGSGTGMARGPFKDVQ